MKREDFEKLPHGLYYVWWDSGGCSLAALGSTKSGSRWLAPTNWINTSVQDGMTDGTIQGIYMMKRIEVERVDIDLIPELEGVTF